jgi:hypothetical protein
MYKKVLLSGLFALSLGFAVQAQVLVNEATKNMSQGSKNALVFEIPNAKVDFIIDEWKDFIKAEGKVKASRDKKNDEYMCDNASLPQLAGAAASTVDMYAKIEEFGVDKVQVSLWVDMGGAFLSSYDHPTQYKEAQELIKRFGTKVAVDVTQEDYNKEEKKYKRQEGDLKDLVKDNDRFRKKIEEAKEAIRKAEADIITNEKTQVTSKKDLELQKSVLEKIRQKIESLKKA